MAELQFDEMELGGDGERVVAIRKRMTASALQASGASAIVC